MFQLHRPTPRPVRRLRVLAVLAGMLVAATTWAAPPVVELKDMGDAGYEVVGHFTAPVPRSTAWDVLSDYDRIDEFVSSMRHSSVEERTATRTIVDQRAVASLMFIRRTIHLWLEIHEQPLERIAFMDLMGQSFRKYEGSWQLTESPEGTQVRYELRALPDFAAPRTFARRVMKDAAVELLEQVRTEMVRREMTAQSVK